MNLVKHTEITGCSNEKTVQLALHLNSRKIPVWIRHVVVPVLTDDELSLTKLGRFVKTLDNVQKIELLPFHKNGEFKWHALGLKYTLESTPGATSEDMERAAKVFLEYE